MIPVTIRILIVILVLTGSGVHVYGQPDNTEASEWLNKFIETGSQEYAEKIRVSYPDSPYRRFCDAFALLGVDNKQARQMAETLVQDHPGFAPGYFALGTVLSDGFQKYDMAIEHFNRAGELNSDLYLVHRQAGIAYLNKKDYNAAREEFDILVHKEMSYAQGYILRGVAHYELGHKEKFMADFEIGLQIDYKALAPVFLSYAGEAADQAIEMAPENVIYLLGRGFAYFSNGNYRSASMDFTRGIKMVPESPEFHKYLGACKLFLDDAEGAQKDLNIALGINPNDPEIYYYLAVMMNDVRYQPSMAYEYLNFAIEMDDANAGYYYERSKSLFNMMNYQDALEDINMAISLDRNTGNYFALRGHIKSSLGYSSGDFCKDYHKAEELGNDYNLKRVLRKSCQ